MLPKTYRPADTCHTCRHRHDILTGLYCGHDNSPVPQRWQPGNDDVYLRWQAWADAHEVHAHYTCDEWEGDGHGKP